MSQHIAHIALVVLDYDEAIQYYTQVLNFNLVEDTRLNETKRWVRVAPFGDTNFSLLLAKASTEEQQNRIGNQAGGRVFLFMHTDNLLRDYENYTSKGVKFIRLPVEETWGKVAVFQDFYGNLWDLIQLNLK